MTYTTHAAFDKKIANIKKSVVSVRADIQSALIDATYLCIANSGGTTPFQNILDAVGNTVHRQGVTQWAETFAPVRMEKDKALLNTSVWKLLDRDAVLADFPAFIAETGMNEPASLWYMVAKKSNTTISVFDLDTTLDSFIKKLEKNGLSGLGEALRKAEQDYMADALLAARNASDLPKAVTAKAATAKAATAKAATAKAVTAKAVTAKAVKVTSLADIGMAVAH